MDDITRRLGAMTDEFKAIAQRKNNPAGYMHERVMQMIAAHQDRLPDDMELGVQVLGGSAPPFHLRAISFSNPDILVFIGKDADGNVLQLMQHHSQMSVMIIAMQKLEEVAYRIGFTS